MDYPDFSGKGPTACSLVENPDIFTPDENAVGARDLVRAAKRVCSGCPYVAECLEWAVANSEKGVWGATTERERNKLKRRRLTVSSYR